jgi:prepilin-type N-terminal cleavage/methylation domain-containing protein
MLNANNSKNRKYNPAVAEENRNEGLGNRIQNIVPNNQKNINPTSTKSYQLNPKSYSAFTLVELIVVIVILAILATIAFLSFSSQSA